MSQTEILGGHPREEEEEDRLRAPRDHLREVVEVVEGVEVVEVVEAAEEHSRYPDTRLLSQLKSS